MNQINLDINKSGQIINEPVVLRVGDKDQTITVNLLKDGQPYTSFTTATFFANKPSGSIVANDPANISSGTITYTVPQALVNEFGKITNAYFLIDGKVSTESFVIAVLQGVNISDDLNDYIPGMSNLNVIYDKWKDKLQAITDELNGVDAPKEVKNVIDNELKNYTDQVNELQKRITAVKSQLDALVVPVNAVGTNLYTDTRDFDNPSVWNNWTNWSKTGEKFNGLTVMSTVGDWRGLGQNVQAKKGETYTFSVYARYKSGTGTSTIFFTSPGAATTTPGTVQISLNADWQRVTFTTTVTADGPISARIERTDDNTNTLLIAGPKLEKGSVATDYSLNPLDYLGSGDVQTAITNALSDVKTQIQDSAVGTNLLLKTYAPFSMTGNNTLNQSQIMYTFSRRLEAGTILTLNFDAVSTVPTKFTIQNNGSDGGTWMSYIVDTADTTKKHYVATITLAGFSQQGVHLRLDNIPSTATITISNMKLELGSNATDYSLNPEDIATNDGVQTAITNALGKVDVGKTITATDDAGKTVKLKITGIS
ncbi:hypothetical protein [Companilactobacillus paralimentarius]|uniref:phage head spike fiber domain-containing protein n=1 Tax=Companilactobacillus paralimentarius TaxID=83526 RepID=UPI00384F1862